MSVYDEHSAKANDKNNVLNLGSKLYHKHSLNYDKNNSPRKWTNENVVELPQRL